MTDEVWKGREWKKKRIYKDARLECWTVGGLDGYVINEDTEH